MSATTVKNNTRTFVAGEALDAYMLVDIESDGSVTKASETSVGTQIGYTVAPSASGEAATISLLVGGGTSYAIADGAVAIGSVIYSAAGGKVTETGLGPQRVGLAISAATADGDVIEVIASRN